MLSSIKVGGVLSTLPAFFTHRKASARISLARVVFMGGVCEECTRICNINFRYDLLGTECFDAENIDG